PYPVVARRHAPGYLTSHPSRRSSDLSSSCSRRTRPPRPAPTLHSPSRPLAPPRSVINGASTGQTSSAILAEYPSLGVPRPPTLLDRKSTRLNSSHQIISYAVFCFKQN